MSIIDELHNSVIQLLKAKRGLHLSESDKKFKVIKVLNNGILIFANSAISNFIRTCNDKYNYVNYESTKQEDECLKLFAKNKPSFETTNEYISIYNNVESPIEVKDNSEIAIFVTNGNYLSVDNNSYALEKDKTYIIPFVPLNSPFIKTLFIITENEY